MIDLRKYSSCSPDELRRFVIQVKEFRELVIASGMIGLKLQKAGITLGWDDEDDDLTLEATVPISTITVDDEEAENALPFDEPVDNVVPFRGRA